ncbi:MAG TPA: hypothetical protein VK782_02505 [Candidatus Sulfotelmatobacter sp.]|jgi:hypothetical protein|nr:hypothetical protein [Candidatus Sulfotelmatobacter sp.]
MNQDNVFEEFCADREGLEALGVTAEELQTLSRVSLLGTLSCKEDVEFILRQIREARRPAEPEPSISNAREHTEAIRLAALEKLNELDLLNAKRKRTRWRRFKMMLTRRNDSSQSFRGN